MTQAITANRLIDGRVVYLAGDGGWTPRFEEARRFEDAAEADAAVARIGAGRRGSDVVDAYAFHVEADADGLRPRGRRETIRTRGPSVRTDLGYQAGNA